MIQALAGKRALVTGADRGIGSAVAEALSEQGAVVCRNFFLQPEEDVLPLSGSYVVADIRDPNQVASMFTTVEKELGGIDLLVNNAGVESIIPAIDLMVDEWDRIFDTNLRGSFLCAQAAARLMRTEGAGGVIVNISSIHEQITRLGTVHYSASKAGMAMLTKSLAHEWGEYGIRVVGVSPGIIETEINREQIERFGRSRFTQWVPTGSLGSVDDVSNAVVFLASDDARYISGTTLVLDGGYSLTTVRYDPRTPS